VKACKLFDYNRRQWVDFNGHPTGPIIGEPSNNQ
jgi:hypothetical protein